MNPHRLLPRDVAPDDLDQPFWEGCRDGKLLVHQCGVCGRAYWPASCCIEHGAATMTWVPATGLGTVHTYTIFHHAYDEWLAERVPYVIAVIELDEGPFFHSDVVECEPTDVHVGMRVEVTFETIDSCTVIPHFRPVAGRSS
jgi:hypothetical protein